MDHDACHGLDLSILAHGCSDGQYHAVLCHGPPREGPHGCWLIGESELALTFTKGCSPERHAILEFVRRAGSPVAPSAVSAGLGLHPGGTRKLMVLMREQGVLLRVDSGYSHAKPEPGPIPTPSNALPFRSRPRRAPDQP